MIKSIVSEKQLQSRLVYTLPRGGYVVKTSQGLLQVGSPPETIKDSIFYIQDVPNIFCIGENFFNFIKGINVAELEFPIYYNFFIKKRKTIIVGNEKTCETFKKIIKLLLFGENLRPVDNDYYHKSKLPIPDIVKEISFFLNYTFDDIVEFVPFGKNQQCSFGSLFIKYQNNDFVIVDEEEKVKHSFKIPSFFVYKSFYKNNFYPRAEMIFNQPSFGMTCLGASHGFDPLDNTSGFIFWSNGSGIIVDPPVNTTDILHDVGVNPRTVDTMILTHIHADHDSGVFQKILEQNRITIYTTQTIIDLWLKKYSLLCSLPVEEIRKMFDFVPVIIDKPVHIQGLEFYFRYMMHSIPTIGFTLKMRDKNITFSSDHLNEPVFFKKLLQQKYIQKERYDELMNFPWESDVIYHEAGIPPLHTPVTFLDSLPHNIKKKLFLYHISEANVPPNTLLLRCKPGISNTVTYEVKTDEEEDKKNRIKKIISRIALFRQFNVDINQCCDFLFDSRFTKKIKLVAGEILSLDSTNRESLLIVISGALALEKANESFLTHNKRIIPDYQLICGYSLENSTNTLRALSKTTVLQFNKIDFLTQIKNPKLESKLAGLVGVDECAWDVLLNSIFLNFLTDSQKVDFVNLLNPVLIDKKEVYQIPKTSFLALYYSGRVYDKNNKALQINIGDLLGDCKSPIDLPFKGIQSLTEVEVKNGLIYHVEPSSFKFFCQENPGFYYRYTHYGE